MTNSRCYCLMAPKGLRAADRKTPQNTKAALIESLKWEADHQIRVHFLGGSKKLQHMVLDSGAVWFDHTPNLRFELVDKPRDAEVRIAFTKGDGSWSMLGTGCRHETDPAVPTMNFGWIDEDSDRDELNRVARHEFGHMLGLIHEHQNRAGGLKWRKQAVYDELMGPPNNWDKETLDFNMFHVFEGLIGTDFDPDSVMLYPIPASWHEGGVALAGGASEISTSDIAVVKHVYSADT